MPLSLTMITGTSFSAGDSPLSQVSPYYTSYSFSALNLSYPSPKVKNCFFLPLFLYGWQSGFTALNPLYHPAIHAIV